jgi:aspartate aminotransferase-like enzyme
LAFIAVSDRAIQRARQIPHRGWYFDFLLYDRYLHNGMTPATPAMALLYALDLQLDRILTEGLPARHERHRAMAEHVQRWGRTTFGLYAQEGYRSKTVTTLCKRASFDIASLIAHLKQHDLTLATGYGALRDATFRIGHMGDLQVKDVRNLTDRIDEYLAARK